MRQLRRFLLFCAAVLRAVGTDTQDVYLSAHLKNDHMNTVAAMPSVDELARLPLDRKIGAFAANRQRRMEAAARFPKLRVLADNYFVAGQAVAFAKGDAQRLAGANQLLRELLASGFVQACIECKEHGR
jgi:hypothetical protein